jgi:hypothetical protein
MGHTNLLKGIIAAASVLILLTAAGCEEEIGAPPGPPAPDNLTAEVDGGSVRLRWNATDPDEYRLERSDLVPGNFNEIAIINGDTTEYLDSGVIFGDTYYYRVRAFDEDPIYDYPFSNYSNEVEITVE